MTVLRSLSLVGPAISVLIGLASSSGCGTPPPPATLDEASGAVTVNQQPARAPQALSEGDAVFAGKGAFCRVRYVDDSVFCLIGETEQGTALTVAPRVSGAAAVLVRLLRGTISFIVPPSRQKPDKYDVEGLNTVTAIEGTSGKIVSTDTSDTIALREGKVSIQAKTGGAEISLHALQQVTVTQDGKVEKPIDYDPYADGHYYPPAGRQTWGSGSGN